MTFDGAVHLDSELSYPIEHYPRSPYQGHGLAKRLDGAYMFCQWHSRLIGNQTYRDRHDVPQIYEGTFASGSIFATEFVDVAQFHRFLPIGAQRIHAEVSYVLPHGGTARISTRIRVTDDIEPGGTDSTVSNTVQHVHASTAITNSAVLDPSDWYLTDYGIVSPGPEHRGHECRITVAIRCLDAESLTPQAVHYRPVAVTSFWEYIGG